MTDGEALVGTGGFRVSGERALKVLRSSQLGKNPWRPLLWFRVAAALGARRMEVSSRLLRLSLAFDGRPLQRGLLEDPYAHLLGAGGLPEGRWLSYALVHTLLPGVSVSVTSGRGKARHAVLYDESGRGTAAQAELGPDTVVTVRWRAVVPVWRIPTQPPWRWFESRLEGVALLEAADAVPFGLTTPLGAVAPWERRKEPEARVLRQDGRRCRVRFGSKGSLLTLHHLGVRVHAAPLEDLALPLSVDVDDPGLLLDASLRSPAQGPALEGAVAAGLAAGARHCLERLARHRTAMRLAARLLLLRPSWRRLWAGGAPRPGRVGRGVSWSLRLSNFAAGGLRGDALRIARAAEFCAFLQEAALDSLRGRNLDERDPVRKALWETPLLLSATGLPLSLADLDLDERPASVWNGTDPAAAGSGAMMVWGLRPRDAAFAKDFPRRRARVE